jgi:hypothetical protein
LLASDQDVERGVNPESLASKLLQKTKPLKNNRGVAAICNGEDEGLAVCVELG